MNELRMVNIKEVRRRVESLELTGFDMTYECYYLQVNGFELTLSEREYLVNALGCTEKPFKAPRKRRFYLPHGVKLF